jgi:NADH:ubiquinone oxidoreductase subunit C
MHVENYIKKLKPKREGENIWINLTSNKLHPVLKHLKAIGVTRISSITGVDTGKTIEIIYHFIHKKKSINIRIAVGKGKPAVNTITYIYPGANLFERELSEMLGIEIRNHPNLKKLFLSEESPPHPLRKS